LEAVTGVQTCALPISIAAIFSIFEKLFFVYIATLYPVSCNCYLCDINDILSPQRPML
jgi:hypothetical protein